MERNSKWNKVGSIGEAVYLPEASVGTCKNVRNCKQFNVDLANGHCVRCWDRGIRTNEEQTQKRKYTKKSRRRSVQVGGSTYMLG